MNWVFGGTACTMQFFWNPRSQQATKTQAANITPGLRILRPPPLWLTPTRLERSEKTHSKHSLRASAVRKDTRRRQHSATSGRKLLLSQCNLNGSSEVTSLQSQSFSNTAESQPLPSNLATGISELMALLSDLSPRCRVIKQSIETLLTNTCASILFLSSGRVPKICRCPTRAAALRIQRRSHVQARTILLFQILQERALHGMEITHGCERKSPQQKHVSVVGRKATPPTECLRTLTRV